MVTLAQAAQCSDGDGRSVAGPISGAGVPQEEGAGLSKPSVGAVHGEHPGSSTPPALPGAEGSARTLLAS